MSKLGWSEGEGLGVNGDGSATHVQVAFKQDSLGIGAEKKHEDNWLENTDAFDRLLKSLNEKVAAGAVAAADDGALEKAAAANAQVESLKEKEDQARLKFGRNYHRKKFVRNKLVSNYDSRDLANILGTASLDTPSPLASGTLSPAPKPIADAATPHDGNQLLVTTAVSVQDYFATRMAALPHLARISNLGRATPLSSVSGQSPADDFGNTSEGDQRTGKIGHGRTGTSAASSSASIPIADSAGDSVEIERKERKEKKKKRKAEELGAEDGDVTRTRREGKSKKRRADDSVPVVVAKEGVLPDIDKEGNPVVEKKSKKLKIKKSSSRTLGDVAIEGDGLASADVSKKKSKTGLPPAETPVPTEATEDVQSAAPGGATSIKKSKKRRVAESLTEGKEIKDVGELDTSKSGVVGSADTVTDTEKNQKKKEKKKKKKKAIGGEE
ncbi:PIN2/TERF1-interacting telomerase inhibitor 1 [Gonapodya sp. JEL0774]|nr:PIN2/TERF1-interacting telomerase inhibitor 1 [Gonapodya sp. JEL0774]